ncbi:MAG TPA: glutamate--tRNA ligase [Candidatus Paceibacterota bacterium]|nr:glutamate--tRNA ligase [Candidatus Paceibacterota bacterium]
MTVAQSLDKTSLNTAPSTKPRASLDREMPVRVRFAPSPTGFLHIGSVRTALFNWLFARQHSGVFVLRIEDTDKERSKAEYEKDIIENFKWLGLDWDEGPDKGGPFAPYRQSERRESYTKYLERLISEGKAYYCFCSKEQLEIDRQTLLSQGLPPKYIGRCRHLSKEESGSRKGKGETSVIRFLVPDSEVSFSDLVRGKVKFDASLTGDIIIAKNLNEPLYNFAAIVDDELMQITHIIRAEEHLSNTPKQILLQQALGFRELKYAHIPLILNPDRSKMSKRYLESSVKDYREQGYLPEAIINFLALLGWHPKGDKELLDIGEIIKEFDIKRVQKAGAIFNIEKLDWINSQKMREVSNSKIAALVKPFLKEKNISASDEFVEKVVSVERERIKTIKDFLDIADFFFALPDYDAKILAWKNSSLPAAKEALSEAEKVIADIHEDNFIRGIIGDALQELVDKRGKGEIFWPLRVAVSGKQASPDPLVIMETLGKDETMRRVKKGIEKIGSVLA